MFIPTDLARQATVPLLLAAGLIAVPTVATAGAETSATATMLLSIEDIDNGGVLDTDLTATYYFDVDPGINPVTTATTSGNAIASALGKPEDSLEQVLGYVYEPIEQESQSQAEAYYYKGPTPQDSRSTANASFSSEGVLEIENLTANTYRLTIGYEVFLEALQEVTGVFGFASAWAFAEYAITDMMGQVDLTGSVSALSGGTTDPALLVSDAFTLELGPNAFNSLSIQLNTEADAVLVPVPAPLALLAFGLTGIRVLRARRT
jgi:hypothetical protein